MSKVWIGRSKYGELIQAEVNEDGTIRGFSGFQETYEDAVGNAAGYNYLQNVMWTHDVTLEDGRSFKTGDVAPEEFKFDDETKAFIDDAIEMELTSCDECGLYWDTETFEYERGYVFGECALYCKDCAPDEVTLKEVNDAEDIFSAPDATGLPAPKGYIEVEELFCDSSGFGRDYERALTKAQAIERVTELLSKHRTLWARITGIGQFQVYVTLYRKRASRAPKKAKRGAK